MYLVDAVCGTPKHFDGASSLVWDLRAQYQNWRSPGTLCVYVYRVFCQKLCSVSFPQVWLRFYKFFMQEPSLFWTKLFYLIDRHRVCIVCCAKNCAVLVFSKFDSDSTILFIENLKQLTSEKKFNLKKKNFCIEYYSGFIKKWKNSSQWNQYMYWNIAMNSKLMRISKFSIFLILN